MSVLERVQLSKPLADYLRIPLEPIARATADDIIDFLARYQNFAVDLFLLNLDGVAGLTFFMNGNSTGSTLPASAGITFENTLLYRIRIVSNAGTGSWQLTPLGVKYEVLVKG